jgi:hypothetical protein
MVRSAAAAPSLSLHWQPVFAHHSWLPVPALVRNAQYEPDAPPVKPFFSKRTFVTGRIFWADFDLKSRGFAKIGKTSGGIKV